MRYVMDCNSVFRQFIQSSPSPHSMSQQMHKEDSEMLESGPGSPAKLFKSSFTIDSILGRQESEGASRNDVDIVSVEKKTEELRPPTDAMQHTKQANMWAPSTTPLTPSYNMMLLPGFGISPPHIPVVGAQPHRLLYRNQMCTCGDPGKYHHMSVQLTNEPNYSGGIALVDPSFRHPLSFHECYFAGNHITCPIESIININVLI